jgi:hypothetical protein
MSPVWKKPSESAGTPQQQHMHVSQGS